jgi:two-component system NtrC family sensor kinase
VLRHSNVSVADLAPGKVADAQDLLEDALKSNMETARLYSELKQTKDALETKSEEMTTLFNQLERANQDNLKTRRYLEGLIQSVAEAIISFSHDGRILTWNSAAEQIFGYPRSEIVGHSFQQLIPSSRTGELEQAISQVSKGQTLRDIPSVRLRKGGQEFPVSATYAPIRGSDDRVLAFSALVRDMGEQRTLERKLEHAETSSSLARIMPPLFNQLTNRLGPVLLQKGLLMETTADPEQQLRMSRLLQAVDAAQNLLRPLLMVLSPSSPRLESSNVNRLVQEAAKRVEAEAAATGVTMDFTFDPNVPDCGLDPDQLREALVNLFRSGIFAAVKSAVKRVRVGTRLAGDLIQVVSQDTGPAIPEPEKGRVFDLAGASDVESLGLCTVATVAQAHGGRVSVRSQAGVGNAFLVELPMVDAAPNAAASPSLKARKVLVVDDEAFLLECLVDALDAWGCEVTPCGLAAEAIQKLQMASYDLIVSDIRMPGLTGIQLFEWIREHQPEMAKKIIFTTGDAFDPETRTFLEQSKLPHLGKPFDLKKLKQALGDLLA